MAKDRKAYSQSAKKISIFLTDLGGGGAERVMLNLANGFIARGFEVDLLLVNSEGPYLSKLHRDIKLIGFKASKLSSSVPELISYLRQTQPDILMTALEDTNLAAIFAHLLACVPTRMVVTVHNNLTQESKRLKSLKRKLVPKLIRWTYPFADLVVAVSHGVAEDLTRLGIHPDKVRVVYNPIITPDFDEMTRAYPEHPWFSDPDYPVVLGVGRLEPQKDFETLIRAYSLVRQQRPARLMILGQGSQHQRLLAFCKERNLSETDVTFPGFVENPLAYMAHASVCVLSSAWEGFGNVLVESMGAGTPVVSTDCPSGPAEILENGKYGRLVPVGAWKEMSSAILDTLNEPPRSPELKQRAQHFRLEKILDEYQQQLFD